MIINKSSISLITPCFNPEKNQFNLLAESVKSQTNLPDEWIIIDGGSCENKLTAIKAIISSLKDKTKAAIASKLSSEIYGLEILKSDIQDDKENFTRFLVFQKNISQPEFKKNEKYITSFIFKLKNKPAALFQSLTGMSLRQVDMTKLHSFPEKGTFSSYFFTFFACDGMSIFI